MQSNIPEDSIVLSYSKLYVYLTCPLRYKYKYEDKMPDGASYHLYLGQAFHDAFEYNDNNYIQNRKHISIKKLQEVFENNFNKRINSDGILVLLGKEYDDSIILGKKMVEAYAKHIRARKYYNPKVLEQSFECKLEDSNDVYMRGFIDLITEDGYIKDRKTSKGEYKILVDNGVPVVNPETGNLIYDGDPQKKIQLIMYALWYRQQYKTKEKGLQYEVCTKHASPRVQVLDILVTDEEIAEAKRIMEDSVLKIKNGVFSPKPGYDTCQYCPYSKQCEAINDTMEMPTENGTILFK